MIPYPGAKPTRSSCIVVLLPLHHARRSDSYRWTGLGDTTRLSEMLPAEKEGWDLKVPGTDRQCDRLYPTCAHCAKGRVECEYDVPAGDVSSE